jgi:hypothetical protein
MFAILISYRPRKRNARRRRSQKRQRSMHVRQNEERLLLEAHRKARAKGRSEAGHSKLGTHVPMVATRISQS